MLRTIFQSLTIKHLVGIRERLDLVADRAEVGTDVIGEVTDPVVPAQLHLDTGVAHLTHVEDWAGETY